MLAFLLLNKDRKLDEIIYGSYGTEKKVTDYNYKSVYNSYYKRVFYYTKQEKDLFSGMDVRELSEYAMKTLTE